MAADALNQSGKTYLIQILMQKSSTVSSAVLFTVYCNKDRIVHPDLSQRLASESLPLNSNKKNEFKHAEDETDGRTAFNYFLHHTTLHIYHSYTPSYQKHDFILILYTVKLLLSSQS